MIRDGDKNGRIKSVISRKERFEVTAEEYGTLYDAFVDKAGYAICALVILRGLYTVKREKKKA